MRPPYGQTLFELMFTLTIAALVSSWAVTGLKGLREKEEARLSINRLLTAIQTTRHLALSHRRIVTLCPSKTGDKCDGEWQGRLLIFTGAPESLEKKVLMNVPGMEGGSISWQSFRNDNFLQMQGNGLTLAQNGTFIYCPQNKSPRYARAIILNKAGRSRLATDTDEDGIIELADGRPVDCTPR